ncbi:sulfatase-like hydrolase/transferase [Pedobacter frigoris]|uniref:sulfatase-like hydrolase/transferase n=1 Tax=Pedobacter frigoris TaxID=2571272 RepID=UPI00292E23CC|nr:sulfatase-like hydrolase/transferase [Pedobacter frigoris]
MNLIKKTSVLLLLSLICSSFSYAQKKPNIILVLTDDMGYSDISCFGNPLIRTEFLDRMAHAGVMGTNFVTTSPTCSPSRVSLLTGRYCSRSNLNYVLSPGDKTAIPNEEVTIAEMLKTNGYSTACVGKWHIGDYGTGLPNKQGFDSFYGMLYSHDYRFPYVKTDTVIKIFRNTKPEIYQPNDSILNTNYTHESIEFIKKSAKAKQPFFLYLAHNMPHLPIAFAAKKSRSTTSAGGELGDVIEDLDKGLAKVWEAVVKAGEENNTIFIFTSDNGPWTNAPKRMYEDGFTRPYHVGSAGIFRGSKAVSYEGGHRVPFIIYWKGHTLKNKVITSPLANIDILPTLADWTKTSLPDRVLDGESMTGWLTNNDYRKPHKPIYYYNYVLEGVKDGDWKLRVTKKDKESLYELFNVSWDPSERVNLFDDAKFEQQKSHLLDLFKAYPGNAG